MATILTILPDVLGDAVALSGDPSGFLKMRRGILAQVCKRKRGVWGAKGLAFLLGAVMATAADAQTPVTRLSLDEAVQLATRDNPGLRAKQLEVRASRSNEVTATLRPNPVTEFRAEQLAEASTGV